MVEHLNLKKVEIQTLDQWFSTLVDTINYDLQIVQNSLVALGQQVSLTTVDTAPIQYLKDSLNELVENLNNNFSDKREAIVSLEDRVNALEGNL